MSAVRIRLGTPGDVEAIARLTDDAFRKWIEVLGRLPLPMQADYAAAIREHRFDLLEADGVLGGLIETQPEPGALLIVNLAVHPDFQGQGFGRRLLALAEEIARDAGLPAVRLYTNKLYEENIRLYESLGYHITGEAAFLKGVLLDMAKVLAG